MHAPIGIFLLVLYAAAVLLWRLFEVPHLRRRLTGLEERVRQLEEQGIRLKPEEEEQ